MKVKSSK